VSQIGVLLVDDHTVFAETLAAALTTNADLSILGIANTATEGLEKATALKPDVALLDVQLPDFDGVELARRVLAASPATKVVMLTGNMDPTLFPRAMAAGACGYLIKDSSLGDVTDAIRRAFAGQVVVPEKAVSRLMEARAPEKGVGADLTDRELEVLSLLAEGSDAKGIAKSLGITWHTARSYVKAVLMKLDAHSQLEAVAKATRLGIVGRGEG
jgi:DNA-binding NarL/FixJ family response regulator